MKRSFILEDLECAHCAQKAQDAVSKLEGVSSCVVNFLTTKMVYEVEDEKDAEVEAKMRKVIKDLLPDVTVVAK